ncbi:hypothetical protein J437_LFUL010647, partial [Ladona fulva]
MPFVLASIKKAEQYSGAQSVIYKLVNKKIRKCSFPVSCPTEGDENAAIPFKNEFEMRRSCSFLTERKGLFHGFHDIQHYLGEREKFDGGSGPQGKALLVTGTLDAFELFFDEEF